MSKQFNIILSVLILLAVASVLFKFRLIEQGALSPERITPTEKPTQPNGFKANTSLFRALETPDIKPRTLPENQTPKPAEATKIIAPAVTPRLFNNQKANPRPNITRQKHDNLSIMQRPQVFQKNSQFTKIDFKGYALTEQVNHWPCARDKRTGLLWEVKLFDGGVSDAEHTYSWFSPISMHAEKGKGHANQGQCYALSCDTESYIQEINRIALCGSTQWRLPTFSELESLIDRDYFNPTINQKIFKYTRKSIYWTQTELDNNPGIAMSISFFNGTSSPAPK
ncbi:MAG: DUF1566 domain-containing protein, partial [Arenicellales bacterium]